MASNDFKQRRTGRVLVALAALAGTAILAAPAQAAVGQGTAAIILAQHDKGRTLSGQGVQVLAGAPASKSERTLSLPISNVDPHTNASATSEGSLSFKRGKRVVALTSLRFNLSAGTLSGNLGGEQLDVFRVSGNATANASSGAVGLIDGKLRLTPDAAAALKKKLNLSRALRRDGVGMAWLAAKANPTHEPAKAVTSGAAAWGFLASWRAYVLGHQGPPMPPFSNGTIEIGNGATATGPLNNPATTYGFPAASGSFEKGLYGAGDKLSLTTQGSLVFKKPAHCIIEISLADLELTLNGANSSLVVGEYSYDIDQFTGMACNDKPSVLAPGTKLATLDASAVTPTYSADGKTVTWSAIPATLTAAGSVPFNPTYKEGQPLDPITVSVTTG